MENTINLADMQASLPQVAPAPPPTNSRPLMDIDMLDDWVPDTVSTDFLRNLTRKYKCHPKARRVSATLTWIQAKANKLQAHQRDRLIAGAPIEEAFPNYDPDSDDDACLLTEKNGRGVDIALKKCIRLHVRELCNKPSSKAAFPDGIVTDTRLQHHLAHRYDAQNPDRGCTVAECCPDLRHPSCSPWNTTFVDCVTTDFISKAGQGNQYAEYGLPREALVARFIATRVRVHLRSMIKDTQKRARLQTHDAISQEYRKGKLLQRRRTKHKERLRACDESPRYRKYFSLLKSVGPEGNSDEETDNEAETTPVPLKVFPLKWRSKEYKNLLHQLDEIRKKRSSHPLLHAGPL